MMLWCILWVAPFFLFSCKENRMEEATKPMGFENRLVVKLNERVAYIRALFFESLINRTIDLLVSIIYSKYFRNNTNNKYISHWIV